MSTTASKRCFSPPTIRRSSRLSRQAVSPAQVFGESDMRPIWLIEAGVYGAEADSLLAEIQRQGMGAAVVPHHALRKGEELSVGGQPLADGDCVIGYGTFPFARQIQLHRRWVPGAWCD